jgi:uncharacterized membrane protein required for colicin V production
MAAVVVAAFLGRYRGLIRQHTASTCAASWRGALTMASTH